MTRKLDDETLVAYADGALGPEEAAAVRAALAADPEAAADVDRFRASARLVRAAFDDTLAEPVPPTLERRIRAAARAAAAERHALDALVRRRGRRPLAIAASVALLLGLGIGSRLGPATRLVVKRLRRSVRRFGALKESDRCHQGS